MKGFGLPFIILAASLLGCSNLKVVQRYANDASVFAGDLELATRYRDTYRREQPYLDPEEDQAERILDGQRQVEFKKIVKMQQVLVAYMHALASLAGEDTFDPAFDVGNLDSSLSGAVAYGVNPAHEEAYAALVNVVVSAVTTGKRHRALRAMMAEADPHVQKLIKAMAEEVKVFEAMGHLEKAKVTGVLKLHILTTADDHSDPAGGSPPDPGARRLLNRLARAHLQVKLDEFDQNDAKYLPAEQGWAAMAKGHEQLNRDLPRLSLKELDDELKPLSRDLQTVRSGLR